MRLIWRGYEKDSVVQPLNLYRISYVMSGHDGTVNVATNQSYNYDDNAWSSEVSLTSARRDNPASTLDSKVYTFGGREVNNIDKVENYDGSTWTTKTSLLAARRALVSQTLNDSIFVFGGFEVSEVYKTEEYNSDSWTTKTSTPIADSSWGVSMIDSYFFIFIETYNYEYFNNVYTSKTARVSTSTAMGYSNMGSKSYSFGGGAYFSNIEEYDRVSNSWTTKTSLDNERGYLTSSAINDDISLCFGGKNATVIYNRNTSFENNTITQKAVMTEAKTVQASSTI